MIWTTIINTRKYSSNLYSVIYGINILFLESADIFDTGLTSLLMRLANLGPTSTEVLFTILFADDTTVTIQGDNKSVLINTLNIELEKLNICLQADKLTINVFKSNYIIFH